MDEAELKEYIKEKSNGRNVVPIRIIDSLLHHEVASRKQLWHDVLVYVRKNYMNLPGSFHDPTLRRDKRLLEKRFSSALSSLVKDGAVTEQKGRDEFMIGLDYPIDAYDVDHPLSMLIWAELDVTPKDPAYDYIGSDDAAKAVKNVEKNMQDMVSRVHWDEEKSKKKSQPSLTKSIGKTVHDATPEMVAFRTIREMEKYMRKFVADVMRHHGNWWKTKAPPDVRKKVHERMEKKKFIRARSDVKLDPIMRLLNDTDMGQLIDIIRANPKEFDKAFGDKNLERIKPFLTGLYEKRNVIDHPDETIPIDEEFLGALDYLCTYVMKQTEIYYQKTSSD